MRYINQNIKAEEGMVEESEKPTPKIPKTTHCSRLSGTRKSAKYTSKVKCFTLQSAQDGSDTSAKRVMLGLKDDKDNSCCDYEPRPVVTKPKLQKENHGHMFPGARKNVRLQNNHIPTQELNPVGKDASKAGDGNLQVNVCMEEENIKNEKQIEEKIDQENSVTFYNSSEQNENSKAFMESLGSWINDFFNVPNKNASASHETKKNVQKDSVLEEDPEYLKSISSIKAQFRKKLKSETSIQVSAPDTPFIFNFDRDFGEKKLKRSSKSLPTTPTDWLEELHEVEEQYVERNPATAGLVIRRGEHVNLRLCKSKNKLHLNGSILVKEKKKTKVKNRHDISELEEYVFPSPSELSRRILLNVNENEKYGQLYKTPQSLGMQEAQHYCQRKSRSRQTITRCYTTKANAANSKHASSGLFHYCTTSAPAVRGNEGILRRNPADIKKYQCRRHSKKDLTYISRDSISVPRMNSHKHSPNLTMEVVRGDVRTSSDDLVKYLMKKIKNTRPQQTKTKTTVNVPQLLSTPKTRFMQSATNTLVSVLAKKENENHSPIKSITRPFTDTGINPNKELILKNSGANIRLDVSRAIAANKYSRLSYLLEGNKIEDDGYLFEKDYKNSKRSNEETQKQGLKKSSSKFNKRQEVKNIFSEIDTRFDILETKPKQKDRKKKIEDSDMKEEQNPRFQKQHELFKTNLKMTQQNTNTELQEVENEIQDCQNDISVATELLVIDKNTQEEDLSSLQEKTVLTEPSNAVLEEKNFIAAPADPENVEYQLSEPDSSKSEKKTAENFVIYKEKIIKPKPSQFFKDPDSKMLVGPLEKLYVNEPNQKDCSKGNDSPLNPSEVGQVKNADLMLLNRRFPTNAMNEPGVKSKSIPWPVNVKTALCLDDLRNDTNGDKKEGKDKKKVKTPKVLIVKDNGNSTDNGGFDKSRKKPGPNCEKDE